MRRGEGGFPDLAFLQFPIAQNDKNAVFLPLQSQAKRQTIGNGEPLPQGAGGHLDPRQLAHVGMPLQAGAKLS